MAKKEKLFPMQSIVWDGHGVIRFKKNRIIDDLLDVAGKHGLDLNQIAIRACNDKYTDAEQIQLAQLIGYSVSGYGDLSYVQRNEKKALRPADKKADKMSKKRAKKKAEKE